MPARAEQAWRSRPSRCSLGRAQEPLRERSHSFAPPPGWGKGYGGGGGGGKGRSAPQAGLIASQRICSGCLHPCPRSASPCQRCARSALSFFLSRRIVLAVRITARPSAMPMPHSQYLAPCICSCSDLPPPAPSLAAALALFIAQAMLQRCPEGSRTGGMCRQANAVDSWFVM